jgi:hypothetical protein
MRPMDQRHFQEPQISRKSSRVETRGIFPAGVSAKPRTQRSCAFGPLQAHDRSGSDLLPWPQQLPFLAGAAPDALTVPVNVAMRGFPFPEEDEPPQQDFAIRFTPPNLGLLMHTNADS